MPEGDSLVRLAHRLRPDMQDQVIKRSDFRVPHLATVDLSGWLVVDIRTDAKYLSVTVAADANVTDESQQLVIVSHLGMDGSWQLDVRPSYTTRCILVFEEHTVVGNSLAKLEMLPPDRARDYVAFLGPDLLDEAWNDPTTNDQLLARSLRNFRAAEDQPIATALLDQRLVSGIGNIYRCEVLLLAGITPHRRIRELSDEQLSGLVLLARDLMVINVPPRAPERARRRTVDVRPDAAAPFGVRVATVLEQARAQTDRRRARNDPNYWVYGRERQGCLKCGGPVRLEKLGPSADKERDLYWCPNCQRG